MSGGGKAALGFAVLIAATYGVTLAGDFVYDDRFIIVENPILRDPGQWGRFFTEGSWEPAGFKTHDYRPLPLLSFAVNHRVGGLQPFGYHLVNLLVHLLAVLGLNAAATRLGLSSTAAWLAGALFAVHPLQAEPVAEVVGRMDLMAGAAFLWGLALHIDARRRSLDGRSPGWSHAGAVGLYAIALLSKEHVILLPLVLLLYDLKGFRSRRRRDYRIYGAYAATAALYLAARAAVFEGRILAGSVSMVDNPLAYAPDLLRVVSALAVAGRYLGQAFLPIGLAPDYCYAEILPFESLHQSASLVTLAATAAVLCVAVGLGRRSTVAAMGLGISVLAFLPVSNLLFPIGTVMGNRLFYLPVAGLALLAGLLFEVSVARRLGAARVGAVGVIAAAAVLGLVQARHWRSQTALDQWAVRAAPRCARGHSNLGYDHLERGELVSAELAFRRSLEIYPEWDAPVAGLASVAHQRGRLEESLRFAERALELNPTSGSMLGLAGEAALRLGRPDAAERYWRRRLELDPDDASNLSNLAILAWRQGRSESALDLWRRAALQPQAPPETWFNLARAYDQLGRSEAAEETYERYLDLEPADEAAQTFARQRLTELRRR